MTLLGLDIGTTGCKAAVFGEDGEPLSSSYREYPLKTPRPGWMELDPEEVWQAVLECLRQAAADSRRAPPTALAISSQGEAVTALDAQGRALANSVLTFDSRCENQVRRLKEGLGEQRFFQITGVNLHTMVTVATIAWWKDNDPELFARARRFLCFPDLILHRLGLPPTLDRSMAARTGGFDRRRREWSGEILGALDIDHNTLADVADSGEPVGELGRAGAELTGLPAEMLVVSGGHDQCCAALGAGVAEEGQVLCGLGTVEAFIPVTGDFKPELGEQGFPCYPHVLPGRHVTAAFNFTGGVLLRWYRDRFFPEQAQDEDVYERMLESLPEEPTSLLVLPYFTMSGTPWFDPEPRGTIVGLSLETTREEVTKALIEGLASEMTLNLELVRKAGLQASRPRAVGGGTRSRAALQIRADVLGEPMEVPKVTEGAAFGAALLAGRGCGTFDDLGETADRMVQIESVIEPDARRHQRYAAQMQRYRKLYGLVRQLGD